MHGARTARGSQVGSNRSPAVRSSSSPRSPSAPLSTCSTGTPRPTRSVTTAAFPQPRGLRYANRVNGAWKFKTLDGVWSTIPNHTNSAVGFAGISAIAKNAWSYRMLEGADGNSGTGISYAGLTPAATFEGGNPVVYYGAHEGLRQTLRRAELY